MLNATAIDTKNKSQADGVMAEPQTNHSWDAYFASRTPQISASAGRAWGQTPVQKRSQTLRTLQRAVGNQAVLRILANPESPNTILQRKCACGGSGGASGECAECQQKRESAALRRRDTDRSESQTVPPIVHEVLRSPGHPLDAKSRAFMEPRFGQDFSGVRIHSNARANASARAVNAIAYTVGQHLIFRGGAYAPETTEGKRLLAHELTHVVQQRAMNSGPYVVQRDADSDDYKRGYQEGLDGNDSNPGPLVDDALVDYNEGYAKGYYEFSQKTFSGGPGPTSSSSPPPSVCPSVPSTMPSTCLDRHNAYAAAAKCVPVNSWLSCVDHASADVCRAVAAFTFQGSDGSDLRACVALDPNGDPAMTRAKGAWFNNTNSCVWGHWHNAFEAVNNPNASIPSDLTPEWKNAVDVCRQQGLGSDVCCRAHVVAEQTAIETCGAYDSSLFGKLPTYVPYSEVCSSLITMATPGIPFTGDFSKPSDRIAYGFLRCCTL